MVRAHIIYNDLSYVEIEEKDSYPLDEMIGEFAGVISLYFGFSVVSVTMLLCNSLHRVISVGKQTVNAVPFQRPDVAADLGPPRLVSDLNERINAVSLIK